MCIVYCVVRWRCTLHGEHRHTDRHGIAHWIRDVRVYFRFHFVACFVLKRIKSNLKSMAQRVHRIHPFRFFFYHSIWFGFFVCFVFSSSTCCRSVVCCRSGNSLEINKRDYFAVRFIIGQLRVYSLASVKRTRVSFSRSIALIQDSKRFDAESQHRWFVVVVEHRHNRIVAFVRNHFVRVMGVWCACDASHMNSIWHVRTNRGPMTKPTNNIPSPVP